MKTINPEIIFIYSQVYDRLLTEYENKQFSDKQIKEVFVYTKKIQLAWDKLNHKICQEISKVTEMQWKTKKFKCYVVKYCKYNAFSDPLTIRMEKDSDFIYSALMHELIHIIFSDNHKVFLKI